MLFKQNVLVALLLGVLVAVAYASTVRVFFLQDDFATIYLMAPPEGLDPLDAAYWAKVLSDFYPGVNHTVYRPLYYLSFGVEYSLYGANPLGYHLFNLALHTISAFFVYLVALELLPGERRWPPAVFAGAIFALYPLSPGVLTWLGGRVDAICAVFLLPSLWFFLRWLGTERRLHILISLGLFFVALLGKETAVVLPGMVVACALYRGRGFRSAALNVVPYAVVLGLYLAIRSNIIVETNYVSAAPLNLLSSSQGILYFTLRTLFPINLNLLPADWPPILDSVFLFWPLLAVAAYFLGRAREKLPVLLLVLYALSVAPVFRALILTEDPEVNFDYERWFYIPFAFMAIFIAYVLWAALAGHSSLYIVASTVACAYFLVILVINNSVYVEAGKISEEILRAGNTPEFPVQYKGVNIMSDEGIWRAADTPVFKDS